MKQYLIEFRFHGYAKKYAKRLSFDVSKKFRVRGVTRKRVVPHITMFGSFTTRNERRVISEVANVAKKYTLVPFTVKGFNYFDNPTNKVIYLDIEPSEELKHLRYELSNRLRKITNTKSSQDAKNRDDFYFHATIAFKDIDRKFDKIWRYLKKKEEPNINQHLVRITILKGRRILREYDLLQKRLLTRKQSLNRYIYQKTVNKLKKEIASERYETGYSIKTKQISLRERINSIFKKKKVFITSDNHFSHKNIIRYCNRPFRSVEEMNNQMIDKWNKVVSEKDIVYHLGDFAFARNYEQIRKIRDRLNGHIILILGNHDKKLFLEKAGIKVSKNDKIVVKNLILSHRPLENIKHGFVNVHGHIHEKRTNGRRINASVDVTNFEPKLIEKYFNEAEILLK